MHFRKRTNGFSLRKTRKDSPRSRPLSISNKWRMRHDHRFGHYDLYCNINSNYIHKFVKRTQVYKLWLKCKIVYKTCTSRTCKNLIKNEPSYSLFIFILFIFILFILNVSRVYQIQYVSTLQLYIQIFQSFSICVVVRCNIGLKGKYKKKLNVPIKILRLPICLAPWIISDWFIKKA